MKFYQCAKCGKIVAVVKESKCEMLQCCNQPMKEIVANTVDAAVEKHKPVIVQNGNTVIVSVGEVAHPMTEDHYIEWIVLQTEQGNQRKELKPGQDPKATFAVVDGDKVLGAYAYCNLHGLWK